MQHFTFGRINGRRVTPLALGTAMFGTPCSLFDRN